jgi:hypothetical protein
VPNPRKPLALARISGAVAKNPARYKAATEGAWNLPPLGPAPSWLTRSQAAKWEQLRTEVWWLDTSHAGIAGIASILMDKLAAGTLGIPGMQLLRVTLGQMGANPVDEHKVARPAADDDDDDEFFR